MPSFDRDWPSARFWILTSLGFLVAVFGLLPLRPRWATLAEICIYAGLLIAMRVWFPWRRLAAMPHPHRRLLAGFLSLSVLGQLVGSSRHTFPFSQWNMYAQSTDRTEVPLDRIAGRTADGVLVDVAFSDLWPTIGWRVEYALSRFVRHVEDGEPAPRWEHVDATLRAVGLTYNRRNSERPLAEVLLRRVTIPIDARDGSGTDEVVRVVAIEGTP